MVTADRTEPADTSLLSSGIFSGSAAEILDTLIHFSANFFGFFILWPFRSDSLSVQVNSNPYMQIVYATVLRCSSFCNNSRITSQRYLVTSSVRKCEMLTQHTSLSLEVFFSMISLKRSSAFLLVVVIKGSRHELLKMCFYWSLESTFANMLFKSVFFIPCLTQVIRLENLL